jgi:hypothetical protein
MCYRSLERIVQIIMPQAEPLLASLGLSSVKKVALAQSVPIADVHMHFDIERQAVAQMMQRMKESNVRWGGGVGDNTGELQAALGAYYLPAIGQAEFTKVLLATGEQGLLNF